MTSLSFVVNSGRRGVIAAFAGLAPAFILLAAPSASGLGVSLRQRPAAVME